MRLKTLAAMVSFVVLTLSGGARAQQPLKSVDTPPAWNDNSLITIQKRGGDPSRSGDVKIEFYGHDAFKLTSPDGLTVLTDPWRNDANGLYPKSILTRAEVDGIVGKFNPKAVIPAHYYVTGLTTGVSGLEPADGWVNYQEKVHHVDIRRLDRAELTLNGAELKGAHHRVYYFGNHFEER
jgi:hypothetical protein